VTGGGASRFLRSTRAIVGHERGDGLADHGRDGVTEERPGRAVGEEERAGAVDREDPVRRRFGERAKAQLALGQRLLRDPTLAADLRFPHLALEDRA
jgi:hypothetical protein